MKTIYKSDDNFGFAPMKREGEWVSYQTDTHKRHVVTPDTVTTLDNKEVHNACEKRIQTGN